MKHSFCNRSTTALLLAATVFVWPGAVRGDQVIPDDLIVQGSICAGLDCVNNESFGFDTLVLKENNIRILFNDTSATAGFAANKWRLIANDQALGGANYFAIEDATALRSILRVDAGAPANSIRAASTGKVGFRTDNPLLDLHMRTGETPAIRFEQTNAGGFTPQTWDIGANEANFFVRDLTAASQLPFRIRPGAPTSSLDIAANGNVSIGSSIAAQEKLHVVSGGDTALRLETTTGTKVNWAMSVSNTTGDFQIKNAGANTLPFRIASAAPADTLILRANGSLQLRGMRSCKSLRTSATGILICLPDSRRGSAAADESLVSGVGGVASRSSTSAAKAESVNRAATEDEYDDDDRSARGCGNGAMAGSWSLSGSDIEDASALWCEVQLREGKDAKYNMTGSCRSHSTSGAQPQSYAVSGGSIAVTAACKFGGSFTIRQNGRAAVTATILEGRLDGESNSRAIGLSRWPRGKSFALQNFTMQR